MGALLRLPGFWQFDAWQDEIYSIYEARDLIHSPFGPGGMELRPLYFLAMHPLAMAAPHATMLLRLPSLIFGLLGIWATWTFTRRHLGVNAAIVATGVLAVLPLHINASHIIRYWSLIYLLGVLYAGAVLRAIATDSRRDHLLALTWLLLGTLTHPTFAISAVGMTAAAHLVTDKARSASASLADGVEADLDACRGPAAGVLPAALDVLHYGAAGGRGGGIARATAARAGIQPLARTRYRELPRHAVAPPERRPGIAPLRIDDGAWAPLHRSPRSSSVDTWTSCQCRCCTCRPRIRWCLRSAGALCLVFSSSPVGERDAALVLVLVLAAALSPSTVSYLGDGARFDYRPSLTRIKTDTRAARW